MKLYEIRALAEDILNTTGLAAKGWRFEFDNAKTRGGVCKHSKRVISMSKHTAPLWPREEVLDVLRHEAGHALVGPGHAHDRVWAAQVRALGGTAKRTHNNETVEFRYQGFCEKCNKVVGGRHRLTQGLRNGAIHPACGKGKIRWIDTKLASV